MKRIALKAMALAIAVAVAGGIVRGILQHRRAGRMTKEEAAVTVGIMPVIATNVERAVLATGNIEGWQEVDVCAQTPENLLRMHVDEGDMVTQGAVIAVLDDEQARASLRAATFARVSAEAEVQLAHVSYTNIMRSFARTVELYTNNVVSQQVYEDADTALQTARSKLAVAEAQLTRLRAAEEELNVRLTRYTIRVPFDGVIARRYVDPGAFVGQGAALVRMVQINPVRVMASIPETLARGVSRGAPARVLTEQAAAWHTGAVVRIHPVIDPQWRTQTVEIECSNADAGLRPGMFARVAIITGDRTVLVVPENAVLRLPGSGMSFVYRVVDGAAVRATVEVIDTYGAITAVAGDLKEGDPVIVQGQSLVQSGMPVTAIPVEMLP